MKYELVKDMFPEYLEESSIKVTEDNIVISFASKRKSCNCSYCNNPSSTVSTYFTRKIQDLNVIEKPLLLEVRLAKYRCENPDCNTKVFSEKIDELARTKQCRTNRLNDMLTKFALTQSAEAAARKCSDINIKVSGDTLLRLSKKWEPSIDETSIYSMELMILPLKKHHY